MSVYSFKSPEMLYLLLLLPFFVAVAIKSRANISIYKKSLITLLRIVAFTLLVFCLAGFSKTFKNDDLYVIYLIDNSDSNSEENVRAAIQYIKTASESMKDNDKAAVVVFGKEAVVEIPFSSKIGHFHISSYINKSHTNIAQAFKIAEVLFPESVQRRIVLFSDGNENEGNAIEEAKVAASHGIEVLTVLPNEDKTLDYSVDKLILPQSVSLNEPFEVRIVMSGNYDGIGKLRVLMDNSEILTSDVAIEKGKKKVVTFQQNLKKKGAHIFDVELLKDNDRHIENNVSQGFVFVAGEQSVLYVYDGENKSEDLLRVLKMNKIKVEVMTPEHMQPSISFLNNYDTVILDNVSATRLSLHHMKSLQMYVKAIGGGLIMLGGENSFGLGGYYRTPLEKALPVEMDIDQQKKYARIAMVVIIDKSGSMSYTERGKQKIELANEGAINVIEMLFETDMYGVIACDSVPKWAVPLGSISDKKRSIDLIASIRAGGGGIYTYSSLFEAYQKLKQRKVNLKHVILFADAADAEEAIGINGEHVYSLAQRMVKDKITITTIAIGKPGDRDLEFLEETAFYGNGRFYFTSDMFTLPQIFAKEAFIATKSLLVEEEFTPVKRDYSAAMSSVDLTKMPPLKGYIMATPKKLAVVPYETNNSDPLLAMWQYGLGRSAAFTSDAKDRWAADWVGSDEYSKFWSQLVRWTLKKDESSNYDVNLIKKNNKLMISVDAVDEKGDFLNFASLKATVVYPDFETRNITLNQTGAGRYEATEEILKSGTYFVNVSRHEGNEITESINSGISLPYLDEYKRFEVNTKFLTHLINVTNGRFLHNAKDVFEHTKDPAITFNKIIAPLILIAIILFVLDAMIRKITFAKEELISIKQSVFSDHKEVEHDYSWLSKRKEEKSRRTKRERDDAVEEIIVSKNEDLTIKESDDVAKEPSEGTTLSKLIKAKKSTFDKKDED
ncbi:VWA domain-containing protein [Thermodesulfobacteriota bacterium]